MQDRLGPRIMRALVRHRRLNPRPHAFSARVTVVQIPLVRCAQEGLRGNWFWGLNRPSLLRVNDADHGDGRPLLSWARHMLEAAKIPGVDGEIWLSCIPRSLGYVFKPVSFWFCENRAGLTQAIIAEVNNTFGERHAYVLDCRPGYANGVSLQMEKCFYVSPFFDAHGDYRFRFAHSSEPQRPHLARIDVFDGDRLMLVTSISGRPAVMTDWKALKAWLMNPFHTLSVIANIHWQALLLWFKRVPL
ncbi:MAG: DUF1365 domain-containing protein, partial [Betaproteobacteria bacterium]|nr:DUF1365 domain-containing protein [Betaproteobacteria bacterium]